MRTTHQIKHECERVNQILLEVARKKALGTKGTRKRLEEARQNDPCAYSYWAQLEFCELIRRQLEHRDTITAARVIRNGAYLFGITTNTAKAYLQTLTSDFGPYQLMGELVLINPDYQPTETNDYFQNEEAEEA
jgi:hypothetical protein